MKGFRRARCRVWGGLFLSGFIGVYSGLLRFRVYRVVGWALSLKV